MKSLIVSFGLLIALSFCQQERAHGDLVRGDPIPDSALEDDILYRTQHASLLVSPPKKLPFYLLVSEGTGYFVDFGEPKRLAPNGVPEDWGAKNLPVRVDKLTWPTLSRSDADILWGAPHHVPGNPFLSIYDATGTWNTESNIYHLDLIFDKQDMLHQYRVRGIGITNSKWLVLGRDGSIRLFPSPNSKSIK